MKRKILSLALALMMIVSIVAAMPVSAAPTESINIDLTKLGKGNDGMNKATDVYTNNKMVATSVPEGADWVDKTQPVGFYKSVSSMMETYGQITINVPEAGYYDIKLAYGSPVDAYVGFRSESAFVQEKVTATGAGSTAEECDASKLVVNVKEFGRKIYLPEGSQKVYLHVKPNTNANAGNIVFYAYSLLLTPSADQETIADIVMAADFNDKTYSGGGDLFTAPADNFGWVPASLGLLATNAYDGNYKVYIPADGYYEISTATAKFGNNLVANIKYEGTTVASNVALCTGSTGATDTKVVTTKRFFALKGLRTITMDYVSGNDYFRGLKLSWSQNQNPEPVNVSFAKCKAYSCYTSDTVFNGMAVPAGCEYDWVTSKSMRCYYGQTSLFQTNVTLPKTGYYDVYVASTSLNDSNASVFGGGAITSAKIPATGDKTTVAVTNMGKIYLGKGTQGIHFQIKVGDNKEISGDWSAKSTELFDLRLEYSEEQTEVSEIILSADAPSRFAMTNKRALGQYELHHTWPLEAGTNKCKWATAGVTTVKNESTWYEYDFYVPAAGYYNIYTATCTTNADSTSYLSVKVNDTLYVEASAVVDTNKSALNNASETYFGKAYLNEGINTIRIEGDADSTTSYLFDIKIEETTPGEEDVISLLGKNNNALEENVIAAGDEIFAEVKTTKNAKLFFVSYEETNGVLKMTGITPAAMVYDDDEIKIYRTPLFTAESIVSVFLWDGATFAPLDAIVPAAN